MIYVNLSFVFFLRFFYKLLLVVSPDNFFFSVNPATVRQRCTVGFALFKPGCSVFEKTANSVGWQQYFLKAEFPDTEFIFKTSRLTPETEIKLKWTKCKKYDNYLEKK